MPKLLGKFFSAIIAMLFLAIASNSYAAESASTAIAKFGLAGTWSPDCSKDVTKEYGSRSTYEVGMLSDTKITTFLNGPTGTIKMESKIVSAVRVTDDKIKMIIQPEHGSGSGLKGVLSKTLTEAVVERVGAKMQPLESRTVDGSVEFLKNGRYKNGTPSAILEKCIN